MTGERAGTGFFIKSSGNNPTIIKKVKENGIYGSLYFKVLLLFNASLLNLSGVGTMSAFRTENVL
jgi:hypothetical protein